MWPPFPSLVVPIFVLIFCRESSLLKQCEEETIKRLAIAAPPQI